MILFRSSLRYLKDHPWQIFLSFFGIALGVSVLVSIDISNYSIEKSFDLSVEGIAGKSTHSIIGGPTGVPDSIYRKIRIDLSNRNCAPVVSENVALKGTEKRVLTLLGIDPIAERGFRPEIIDYEYSTGMGPLNLIIVPNSCIISSSLATEIGVDKGDSIRIVNNGKNYSLIIVMLNQVKDSESDYKFKNILLTDISTAQSIVGYENKLTSIELILNESSIESKLKQLLPVGVDLIKNSARDSIKKGMASSFKLNLSAMSLLALIVGMFLIYNTMTFSVVQRRRVIGLMRSIGITRAEIFRIIFTESLIIGILGTIAGIFLGIFLAEFMLDLTSRSMNDLYFTLNVTKTEISTLVISKGLILGVGATLFASIKPAREALNAPVRVVTIRSHLETELRRKVPIQSIIGVILIIAGYLTFYLPGNVILISYFGMIPLIVGFTLLTPLALIIIVKVLKPPFKSIFGILGVMGLRGIISQISRTGIAVAALSIAISAAIGVATMTQSFRTTVVNWLEGRLSADLYVSVPSLITRFNDNTFSPEYAEKIRGLPEIKMMNVYREFRMINDNAVFHILAADIQKVDSNSFKAKPGERTEIWRRFLTTNSVLVSEPYSNKYGLVTGDSISIPTESGRKSFNIAGIYYDYSSDIGLILMPMRLYKKHWTDRKISGIAVFAKDGTDINSLKKKIENLGDRDVNYIVRSNKSLIESSVKVFDRTFIITNILQLLAIGVAFMGVISALMALQLERKKELAVLRATGLTPGELRKLVILQTGIMGLASGLLSLPLGNIIALILTYFINERSFGWTVNFEFMPYFMLQAFIISIFAAILAGIYPAFRMAAVSPAIALRED